MGQFSEVPGRGYRSFPQRIFNLPARPSADVSRMERVLADIRAERRRQIEQYGSNDDLLDGTGPRAQWLMPFKSADAVTIEAGFRREYGHHLQPTWVRLVREEIAEAFLEDDPERLRAELVQVAALCVSWCEKLDARKSPPSPAEEASGLGGGGSGMVGRGGSGFT